MQRRFLEPSSSPRARVWIARNIAAAGTAGAGSLLGTLKADLEAVDGGSMTLSAGAAGGDVRLAGSRLIRGAP